MDAYSGFYRANKDKLFGYLMRMTGDYQLACDIMQESFTRLLARYGPKAPDVALLYTIARNAVYDNARKRVLTAEHLTATANSIDPDAFFNIIQGHRTGNLMDGAFRCTISQHPSCPYIAPDGSEINDCPFALL